jgi:hypothetical protein
MDAHVKRSFLPPLLLLAAAGCAGDRTVIPDQPDPEPSVTIVSPPWSQTIPRYLAVVRLRWTDSGEWPARAVRYFASEARDTTGAYDPLFDIAADLSANPQRYDTLWSAWIAADAPGDSAFSTLIGDDEQLPLQRLCWFAVQARDRKGNVTRLFDTRTNIRSFIRGTSPGPILYVAEPVLAAFQFLGTSLNPETRRLPPGIPLRFRWKALADRNWSEVTGYRFGWDLPDLPSWDATFEPDLLEAPETSFSAGVHTLVVEARDLTGAISRGRITVEIVPWAMDRALLWIDDYYATEAAVPDWSAPRESDHDAFWTGLCSKAPGFDPARDIFDTHARGRAPTVDELGRYRHIVWTYSPSSANQWSSVMRFVPESLIGSIRYGSPNLVSIFLQAGGAAWTLGRSDGGGGLAASIEQGSRAFPLDIACEIAGPDPGCADRSGAMTLAYEGYCVSVVDKVSGQLRTDDRMPVRRLARYDVMLSAVRADDDIRTAACAGLPERLELRDEVAAAGSYFCTDSTCVPGGFTYVEVYDPEYWLRAAWIGSRHCFHPLYRMRAADPASALDGQAVAIWVTGFERRGAPAPPSVHFGFPLWFFRPSSADSIADVVFSTWGIR